MAKKTGLVSARSLFANYQPKSNIYITQEFQDFGYRLACQLDDLTHKSLYIKLAKQENRALLEKALNFVKDAHAQSKAKLFMWKLKELRK